MKKKHIAEAIAVIAVLGVLLWITVPKFFTNQTTLQAQKTQETVDRIYDLFQKDASYFKAKTYQGTYFPTWSGPITRPDGTVVPMFIFHEDWVLRLDKLTENFPQYKFDWPFSRYTVHVAALYAKKDSTPSEMESNFSEKPFYYCVYACVGDENIPSFGRDGQFIVDVDSEGHMQVIPPIFTPYSPSNGLESYGEFYHDSKSDWPKQKAVLGGEN